MKLKTLLALLGALVAVIAFGTTYGVQRHGHRWQQHSRVGIA